MPLFRKTKKRKAIPAGLWAKCEGCGKAVFKKALKENFQVCPKCNYHFTLGAYERLHMLLDTGSFIEEMAGLRTADPLGFKGTKTYREKLREEQARTGLTEACVVGRGTLGGMAVAFGVTDSRFIMGSMGSVVGEKITSLVELAIGEGLSLVIVSGSGGGARMHEGMLSLMQMAKTSAALARLNETGLPFISVLTNPTMAGVMASFASLGDIIIAEPGALIGFTGPRVIEQTIRQKLPEGFQKSEFMLEHGLIDMVVPRQELKSTIHRLLRLCR